MLNLKKEILNYKIKKIIKQYPYVLFIQFNNVTPKKWRLIKDQLYKLGIMKTLRVKNQVARKLLKNADSKKNLAVVSNSTATLKQPLTFPVGQRSGDSILLNSSHAKVCEKEFHINSKIRKIGNSITSPAIATLPVATKVKEQNLFLDDIFQGPTLMLGCPIVEQLPGIYNILEQNSNLLFVGGLFENQVITHLDFKKIIKLDKSIFINLIQQCSSPMDSIFYIKSLMDLHCFTSVQKSLLQTLNSYKEIIQLPHSDK